MRHSGVRRSVLSLLGKRRLGQLPESLGVCGIDRIAGDTVAGLFGGRRVDDRRLVAVLEVAASNTVELG